VRIFGAFLRIACNDLKKLLIAICGALLYTLINDIESGRFVSISPVKMENIGTGVPF
jgi:hypothetical protein